MFLKTFTVFEKIGWWFLGVSLFLSPHLCGQNPNLSFRNYTVEHGLAQSAAFCILQDRRGFIWIGTEQGLNRFDGYNFVIYKFQYDDPNCLSNSYILSLHEDPAGILWIGTNGGGLNRFDPDTQRFSHYFIDPDSMDSVSNIVNVIFEDHSGGLWIGTAGGGLKKFDREKETFIHYQVFPVSPGDARDAGGPASYRPALNTIDALWEDYSGSLWIGTNEGLYRLDQGKSHPVPAGLEGKKILALYEDKAGISWVGTGSGFYSFVPGKGNGSREFVPYRVPADEKNLATANTIRTFYEDRLGIFWIGTDYGLYIFDRQKNRYLAYREDPNDPYSLIGNDVRDICEDRSGALWVGVYSGGLSQLSRTQQSFRHYYYALNKPGEDIYFRLVFEIYEDRQEILWLGTYGEGLVAFNRVTGTCTNYRNRPDDPSSLSDNSIWALCEDREGVLWIGTAGKGVDGFSRDTGRFTHYRHQPQNPNSLCDDTISIIIEDGEGNLWIGTNGGLNRLDPQRKTFTSFNADPKNPHSLAHNLVYVIQRDHRGLLWIGTRGGLSILDPQTETFSTYRVDPSNQPMPLYYPIFSMCEDRRGVMWLGTTGGLNKFDRDNGYISLYTEKDGLPNDVINGILEDDQGYLWLSTNKGISKFDPGTGKFRNYSMVDGLQDYEFCGGAYYKNRRGELFFGGLNGFNSFFPVSIKDNPYIPPVVITGFQVFNQPVPIGKEFKGRVILKKSITAMDAVTLSYKDYIFSFEFAALNYLHGENNEYAYMMEGIEKNWNYVGQRRFVTYANLAPGDYRFRVKGSNNHGVWNEEGISLKIKITPPFQTTWWFKSILGLGVIFLGLGFYRVRSGLISRRNRELEEMVTRRTIALKESGEKYITMVERAHHGIAIVQDERMVFLNTPLLKLLGYEEKEMIDGPLLQWVAPGKQAGVDAVLEEFKLTNKVSGNIDTVLRHKDGQDIHVDIHYGNIIYRKRPALLMFFQDIRMQKLLEEERMRTAKLESTRVLVGGLAHDFNNLLAVIMGNLELSLGDVKPGDDIYKALSEAERATLKARDLVHQFITLSKGEKPLLKKIFIQGAIREVVEPMLQDTGVTVHFDLPEHTWPVDCDVLQVKQALKNIVLNAQQAMLPGGLLQIKVENEETRPGQIPDNVPGKYVCISIKDNGKGIPKEDLPKIFDPYFSTRGEVTRKGLGLGLTVVHSIIKRHGGSIRVTSEVGIGTTVRIYLPISKEGMVK